MYVMKANFKNTAKLNPERTMCVTSASSDLVINFSSLKGGREGKRKKLKRNEQLYTGTGNAIVNKIGIVPALRIKPIIGNS